jgi:hypothetical protein
MDKEKKAMSSSLSAPHLHNEEAAYAYVEARIWPHGPTCPRCEGRDRIRKLQGKSTRIGTYYCNACRKPFTVKCNERVLLQITSAENLTLRGLTLDGDLKAEEIVNVYGRCPGLLLQDLKLMKPGSVMTINPSRRAFGRS